MAEALATRGAKVVGIDPSDAIDIAKKHAQQSNLDIDYRVGKAEDIPAQDRSVDCVICFDVLDRLLSGNPIGRIAGAEVMKFDGWQRLHKEYANQFGIELPKWPPQAAQNS